MKRNFYTAKKAAEHLGISTTTFWRLRKEFPVLRPSKSGKFEEEELERWFMDPTKVSSYKNA